MNAQKARTIFFMSRGYVSAVAPNEGRFADCKDVEEF
jgi:hypothetical protein